MKIIIIDEPNDSLQLLKSVEKEVKHLVGNSIKVEVLRNYQQKSLTVTELEKIIESMLKHNNQPSLHRGKNGKRLYTNSLHDLLNFYKQNNS